jgi:hypothetical protein
MGPECPGYCDEFKGSGLAEFMIPGMGPTKMDASYTYDQTWPVTIVVFVIDVLLTFLAFAYKGA